MKNFMLCADDYGITNGVSKAILQLADKQRLSAVGCMTNFAKWPHHAKEIVPLASKIDIGIHLNLTLGQHLSSKNTVFAPAGTLVRHALLRQLDANVMELEIDAQCAAFENAVQRQPDFIDGHQHVHALPVIRDALIRVVNRRYKVQKPWLRDPSDTLSSIFKRRIAVSKALTVKSIVTGFSELASASSIRTNYGFSGFSAFDARRDFATDFERFLVGIGDKHLIMCHPGFVDDELRRLDPVVETRSQEYDFLFGGRFEDMCKERGVVLKRFG